MSPDVIGELVAVGMFLATVFLVLVGFPVAFTLAGTALIFSFLGHLLGVFDLFLFTGLSSRYFGVMVNEVLVAVPLFVFMGVMLERSQLAEALLETMGQLFGSLRGGLGISVILVGALLAASTGIIGATVVTMGILSLPTMLRAGYDPRLATGIICASGTLGQIIPPSIVLIFMGEILQVANQTAQLARGNFAPDQVSVGDLFAGAFIPGLILVAIYVVWVVFKAVTRPESCPPVRIADSERRDLPRRVVLVLLPPLGLIVAVLGSILSGIATPTESASVGAVGSILLAALNRRFSAEVLREVMRSTLRISSMVFVILIGASVFSLAFRGLGGDGLVEDVLAALPGGKFSAILAVMVLMFVLGFFLDAFEIIFVIVPITAPALLLMDVSPVWLGVLIGVNLQTSFLTPPFGFALFYLRGVAPREVTTGHIYRGIVPFVALQIVALGVLFVFPRTATWLPEVVYGTPAAVVESGDPLEGLIPLGEDPLAPPETDPLFPLADDPLAPPSDPGSLIPGPAEDPLFPADENVPPSDQ
ncbi:MAG: TRAP transporter large permease subunit [Alphaproteobacteria bacterium]